MAAGGEGDIARGRTRRGVIAALRCSDAPYFLSGAADEPPVAAEMNNWDSVERNHGWADGNRDLFKAHRSGPTDSGDDPDIYRSLSWYPDLQL